jgi:hypothetical protein
VCQVFYAQVQVIENEDDEAKGRWSQYAIESVGIELGHVSAFWRPLDGEVRGLAEKLAQIEIILEVKANV